ncbi:hypothetical protein ACYCAX_26560, partial [Pseudomonas sp. MT3]
IMRLGGVYETRGDSCVEDAAVLKAIDIEQQYYSETGIKVSTHAITKDLTQLGCKQKRSNAGRWWITPKGLADGLSDTSTPADLQKAYAA